MLVIKAEENDLLVEEYKDRRRFIKYLDSTYPYRFCSFDLNVIADVFAEFPNFMFMGSSDLLFYKKIKRDTSIKGITVAFEYDVDKEETIMPVFDKSQRYFITDINFDSTSLSYLFVVFHYSSLQLGGSAATYFRKEFIDEILNEL